MDIYGYLNSPDIAAYCRKINKVWTPFEMAVIIDRSDRVMSDKHNAWRELISDYPDMPTPANMHYKSFDSLHEKLREIIDYEERLLALFKSQEPGTVYLHEVLWGDNYERSNSVFTSFEKLWADVLDSWTREEAPKIKVTKINADGNGCIEAHIDYDGNVIYIIAFGNSREWFSHDGYEDMIYFDLYYVDIPLPFKRGDIVTEHYLYRRGDAPVFVIDALVTDHHLYAKYISGEYGDGDDMIGWGFYVSEEGICGSYEGCHDRFEYYRGKLEGKDKLLHYVRLYLNDEIQLPELLTMQCRIMLEQQLDNNLDMQTHGYVISENQFAENRPAQEEKENT